MFDFVPSGLFMFKDDLISPKSVALKSTIPSLVSGMFIVTRRCRKKKGQIFSSVGAKLVLQATEIISVLDL